MALVGHSSVPQEQFISNTGPEEESFFEGEEEARKKRLAGLAAKFNAWEDDTGCAKQQIEKIPTSEVVDPALQKKENVPKTAAQDPSFIKSLKAQGLQETDSMSKLVYDFNRR
ncbi:unnamed protein product [Lepeophtheirus salmonis]|uniref:(salmon louse) hypothetical protein n=1 Tax=Lepeophtheirus salmonis TaxID=72036 RepID=A0A7R8CYH9_LEPSM|nr:unnamed protein product [Lepeophtheirus salmonis]CAF2968751.1 unnamed protein product [Lepeophtheirus salmonis]